MNLTMISTHLDKWKHKHPNTTFTASM